MKPVVVKNCKILNTRSLALEAAANVLIEDGKISRISADEIALPDAQVVDAKGMTLMPGMIDCHVHVVASSFNLGRVAALPNALALLRALPIMQGMLDRGFTSVRDAGGADWALAQAVLDGVIDGPRLYCSGKALSQTGGHGDFLSLIHI